MRRQWGDWRRSRCGGLEMASQGSASWKAAFEWVKGINLS